jgi:hypothetical protein
MHYRVSGAPVRACLTSARSGAHLMRLQVTIGAEVVVAPLLHRTLSGVHRTVRWCTRQSGAPDQGTFGCPFAPFVEPFSWSFYWLIVNLWYLYNL